MVAIASSVLEAAIKSLEESAAVLKGVLQANVLKVVYKKRRINPVAEEDFTIEDKSSTKTGKVAEN